MRLEHVSAALVLLVLVAGGGGAIALVRLRVTLHGAHW
jgi:hypothetical protein